MGILKDILAGWGALSIASGIALIVWVELTATAIRRERREGWDESLERILKEGDRP